MATRILPVEIYADIICPWCYIGKRRLEAAFAERPDVTPSSLSLLVRGATVPILGAGSVGATSIGADRA